MSIISIDVGGTSLKGCIIKNGEITERAAVNSAPYIAQKNMMNGIYDVIGKLISPEVEGVAVSTAGDTDPYNGKIVYATENIPGYSGTPVKKLIEEKYGLNCSVINDVHAALLSELTNFKQYNKVAMITIGTGIGGAYAENGKIVFGEKFNAARFGHLLYEENGKLCTCGKRGCIEQYVSAKALSELINKNGISCNLKEFFAKVNGGEDMAKKVLCIYLEMLAKAIEIIYVNSLFDVLIIGGGITGSSEIWLPELKKLTDKNIQIAVNRNDAGLLGAYLWYAETRLK